VPQAIDGHATADRHGGGVKQLLHSRTGEGGTDHGPAFVVDDQLAGAMDAVALGVGAGNITCRGADHGDAQAGGLRLREGHADRADLRVGEGHPGHDAMGGGIGGLAAENRRRGDPAVVLAHVGQRSQPGAVTDRI
jgi:hypothetical protein